MPDVGEMKDREEKSSAFFCEMFYDVKAQEEHTIIAFLCG